MSLKKGFDEAATQLMDGYEIQKMRDGKIVHDPLFGTREYYNYEIAIMDSPIIQRLKRIGQMGLAREVYPSARHSRFEHSIGMMTIATNIFKYLGEKDKELYDEKTLRLLRIGSLIHDVGQGPFSHDSESFLFGNKLIDRERREKFPENAPHEIFSYYFINSSCFQDFLEEVQTSFKVSLDRHLLGNLIMGQFGKGLEEWVANIINGPIDADKLEYLKRDGYASGLPIPIDLDRIYRSLCVKHNENGKLELMIESRGITSIEQIVFNKIFLFSTVYHHQKARACNRMLFNILNNIKELENKPWMLLLLDDYNFFQLDTVIGGIDKEVMKLINNIKRRELLKRGLIISNQTVEKPAGLEAFRRLREKKDERENIEKSIVKRIEEKCDVKVDKNQISIDVPRDPSVREVLHTKICFNDEQIRIDKATRIDRWISFYKNLKWQGHVFIYQKFQGKETTEAIKEVLENELGLQFKKSAYPPGTH